MLVKYVNREHRNRLGRNTVGIEVGNYCKENEKKKNTDKHKKLTVSTLVKGESVKTIYMGPQQNILHAKIVKIYQVYIFRVLHTCKPL